MENSGRYFYGRDKADIFKLSNLNCMVPQSITILTGVGTYVESELRLENTIQVKLSFVFQTHPMCGTAGRI